MGQGREARGHSVKQCFDEPEDQERSPWMRPHHRVRLSRLLCPIEMLT